MEKVVEVCKGSKFALTVVLEFRVMVHVPIPLHPPPLQPVNTAVPGVVANAVRVTIVPEFRDVEHVDPQFIPPTLDVTVPAPCPVRVMDRE